MKAVDILYLSLGMMLYPLFACGANATDNKKDIATYFANSLKGEKVEYSISKKVKKNEVNKKIQMLSLLNMELIWFEKKSII